MYTNFITGHNLKPRDSVHWQLQSFTALLVLIETISEIVKIDQNYSIDLSQILPLIQDTLIQSYRNLANSQLQ